MTKDQFLDLCERLWAVFPEGVTSLAADLGLIAEACECEDDEGEIWGHEIRAGEHRAWVMWGPDCRPLIADEEAMFSLEMALEEAMAGTE